MGLYSFPLLGSHWKSVPTGSQCPHGIPWDLGGTPVGLQAISTWRPWCYAIVFTYNPSRTTVFALDFYGTPMGLRRIEMGSQTPVGFRWDFHCSFTRLNWQIHGTVVFPRDFHTRSP